MAACESCGDSVGNAAARYCSNACRQRAYRQRNRDAPAEAPSDDDLPHQLDGFVGREEELTGIARLLRYGRIVTLLGPAGAGKTRVAAELAARVRRRFSGGVRFVDLGELATPELVGQAVASAVGASEEPGRDLTDALVAELRDKDLLLVLDNCEHLVEASGELVVRLLRRCGGLRVLATSREMLRLPGEMIFPIGELPAADAVRLFVDRAKAVAPGFAATDEATIDLICTRLDRMPLAVELAARLVRVLPLQDIVAGLDDRFEMLASTARGSRDLLAAIEWSYELLDPAEQAVFRRLSVLPGGFGIDLAIAVGGATVALMSTLEAKSVISPIAERPGRFRQLESVRCFARRELDESGERAEAEERLVAWLTSLATPLIETFATRGDALDRLTVELQNLLAGLEVLRDTDDERQVLLTSALVRCRQRQGLAADSCERLHAVLRIEDAAPAYRAYALEQGSWLAAWYNDLQAALSLAAQAVALGPSHGSTPLYGRSLQALAFARQVCGDHSAARESFAECLRHVRGLGEPMSLALCLNNLAWAQLLNGDLAGAEESITEALPLYERHAEPVRRAALNHTTGVLALLRDDPAVEHFTEALRLLENGFSVIHPYAIEGMAVSTLRAGDHERGLRLIGFAESVRTDTGDPWWRAFVAGAVTEALEHFPTRKAESLLAAGRSVPLADGLRYALTGEWTSTRSATDQTLTGRQLGVAALVVEGLTNRQIASRLKISERTVEMHLDNIRTKLDLRSRAQVAAWAATHAR